MVTLAGRVAVLVLSFATAVLLARGLGPSARGVLALAVLSSQALALLCGFGLGLAAMHFAGAAGRLPAVASAVTTLTLAGTAAVAVLVGALAVFVAQSGAAAVNGLTAADVGPAGLAVPPLIAVAGLTGLLRGIGRMRAAAVPGRAVRGRRPGCHRRGPAGVGRRRRGGAVGPGGGAGGRVRGGCLGAARDRCGAASPAGLAHGPLDGRLRRARGHGQSRLSG